MLGKLEQVIKCVAIGIIIAIVLGSAYLMSRIYFEYFHNSWEPTLKEYEIIVGKKAGNEDMYTDPAITFIKGDDLVVIVNYPEFDHLKPEEGDLIKLEVLNEKNKIIAVREDEYTSGTSGFHFPFESTLVKGNYQIRLLKNNQLIKSIQIEINN